MPQRQPLIILALVLLLTACTSLLRTQHDQLRRDRAYAIAAMAAWQAAYRDGELTTAQWHEGREAYEALATAQQAYVRAIQSGQDVEALGAQQRAALQQFQALTRAYGVRVTEGP